MKRSIRNDHMIYGPDGAVRQRRGMPVAAMTLAQIAPGCAAENPLSGLAR